MRSNLVDVRHGVYLTLLSWTVTMAAALAIGWIYAELLRTAANALAKLP